MASSVTKSCPTLRDPHGLQHSRLPCPSPSPRVCPSSCLLNRWCHPIISSSDALFTFCPQPSPAPGFFPVNQEGGVCSSFAHLLPSFLPEHFRAGGARWATTSMGVVKGHGEAMKRLPRWGNLRPWASTARGAGSILG